MEDLKHPIVVVLVDKALIGVILVVVGFWLNRRLEILRAARTLMHALIQQRQKVEDELTVGRHARRLAFLEKQLSTFYWPLYLRLEKDNAMWKRIAHLTDDARDPLPAEAGHAVERGYILPNHAEAVALIEQNAHLIDDEDLFAELLHYVRHVAVYQAVRGTPELKGRDPRHLGEPFPETLFPLVEGKLRTLQDEYRRLLHSTVLDREERAGGRADPAAGE
jgi:hypothetical protein